MVSLRFSAGTPARLIEVRLRHWGLEEYFVDGRLLQRRWRASLKYQRGLRVGDSDVVVEAVRQGRTQVLRAVVDGVPVAEQQVKQKFGGPLTLIEIVIVIAVIGVLGAIALPPTPERSPTIVFSVRDEIGRLHPLQARIAELYREKARWPTSAELVAASGPLPVQGRYPYEITDEGGLVLQVREFGLIGLRPAVDAKRDVVWLCGNAKPPPGYVPSGANRTTAGKRYRPPECD